VVVSTRFASSLSAMVTRMSVPHLFPTLTHCNLAIENVRSNDKPMRLVWSWMSIFHIPTLKRVCTQSKRFCWPVSSGAAKYQCRYSSSTVEYSCVESGTTNCHRSNSCATYWHSSVIHANRFQARHKISNGYQVLICI
jgi:hypothetical protein